MHVIVTISCSIRPVIGALELTWFIGYIYVMTILYRSFGLFVPKNVLIIWLPIIWLWVYLVKIVPETRHALKIRDLRFYVCIKLVNY